MNAKQAAAILGISSRGLYALAAPYGPIPCYRIGRRIVFNEADVVAFKESHRISQVKLETRIPGPMPTIRLKASDPEPRSNLDKAMLSMGIVPKWMRDAGMDVKALKAKAAAKKKASAASTPRKRSTGGPAT
ncbi:helix-turn-helix domain-containing protein [Delftia tsuruhatensis]|uniref:helix-turn-helix domain-containing protein n=1 Tax=Delftia tsuruhatensis TaxID=180282 RepID=UPI0028A19A67|nr:helix-turn-helix domain-containing protein [Delftia tsuruhatensis]